MCFRNVYLDFVCPFWSVLVFIFSWMHFFVILFASWDVACLCCSLQIPRDSIMESSFVPRILGLLVFLPCVVAFCFVAYWGRLSFFPLSCVLYLGRLVLCKCILWALIGVFLGVFLWCHLVFCLIFASGFCWFSMSPLHWLLLVLCMFRVISR